jgi:hypothetical protein
MLEPQIMKNLYGTGLLLLILLDLPAFAESRPTIDVPYMASEIVIDGNNSDWTAIKSKDKSISFYKGDGYSGTPTNLGTTTLGLISNEADCHVDLWLSHDGNYLYILAEVYDDSYEPFDADNLNMAYLEDTLHLYIDSTNAGTTNIPYPPITNQFGYEQFGISTDGNIYGENSDFTTSSIAPAPQGAHVDGTYWVSQCQVHSITGGYLYVFEERIDMAGRPDKNMNPLIPGNSYGFDAEFCDADYGVQLQGYIFWSSNGLTDAWNYENLWGTMTLIIPGDINYDNHVNFQDYALFAEYWLRNNCTDCNGADITGDGTVGLDDLLQFAQTWLAQ